MTRRRIVIFRISENLKQAGVASVQPEFSRGPRRLPFDSMRIMDTSLSGEHRLQLDLVLPFVAEVIS